jgi:hypothetical protein
MRAYSAGDEEALRARNLLKEWADDGLLTEAQHLRMEQDAVCELRRTNVFLRLVLFLFTLCIVLASVALFFTIVLVKASAQTTGVFLLIFASASYAAAEFAVLRAHLYRFGIEEALAVCSVGFLCAGFQFALFNGNHFPATRDGMEFLVPAVGAMAALWIWHRFGLAYAFPGAMIFVVLLPPYWTSSHAARHMIVAAIYAAGLIVVAADRPRHRFEYLDEQYSIAEALLWLGFYLAINLQLSSIDLLRQSWNGFRSGSEFSKTFYWTTWMLIWCIPPAALTRGLRKKDRFVIAAGAITAILSLATNKPYLGWQRHSWDPMILGALLVGVAVFVHRWLASGEGGIRHGFTAQRFSGKEKRWMNIGPVAFGLASPGVTPHAENPEMRFGGGQSGGGGATSDF